MYMAMIMRLLIGWALTYGLSVLLAVGYDMLTDVDDFSWPMLVFLVTFNLIAFVASAVGLLKLKKTQVYSYRQYRGNSRPFRCPNFQS